MPVSLTSDHGLSEAVLARIRSVFTRHPQVTEVRLYGSRAKGNFQHGSDIDLLIMGQGVSSLELLQIENDLDDLSLPYMVDLALFCQIDNSALIEYIERVGKIFYRVAPVI